MLIKLKLLLDKDTSLEDATSIKGGGIDKLVVGAKDCMFNEIAGWPNKAIVKVEYRPRNKRKFDWT